MAHSHREQEECYVVISGTGRIRLDGEIHQLRQWDFVRVSPLVIRAFEAGPDGLELIAIGLRPTRRRRRRPAGARLGH
jgi:mannose-6-phosphate isomerase-like protein (cupin superfamily)